MIKMFKNHLQIFLTSLLLISPSIQGAGIISAPNNPLPSQDYSPTYPEWKISSVFGPRNPDGNSTSSKSRFHAGIDYNQQEGDGDFGVIIKALADGSIERIERNKYAYFISIKSTSLGSLEYAHIFKKSNAEKITIDNQKIKDAHYSKVVLGKVGKRLRCNAIYFYNEDNSLHKVLTTTRCKGFTVQDDENKDVKRMVKVMTSVKAGEDIAPMGNSAIIPVLAHLHLGFNRREDNPLAIISHPDPQAQDITVSLATENKLPFNVYNESLLKVMTKPGFVIKVEDKSLRPELDVVTVSNPDNQSKLTEFNFGGREYVKPVNADPGDLLHEKNIKLGLNLEVGTDIPAIKPIYWDESGNPRVMFFFVPYPNIKQLANDKHNLNVNIQTVTGKSFDYALPFTIDLTKVTSITPDKATVDELATFSVNGANLVNGMGFSLNGCTNVNELPGGTATLRQFTCTPTTTGLINGQILDKPNGTLLQKFSVNITTTPTTTVSFCNMGLLPGTMNVKLNGYESFSIKHVFPESRNNLDPHYCECHAVELPVGKDIPITVDGSGALWTESYEFIAYSGVKQYQNTSSDLQYFSTSDNNVQRKLTIVPFVAFRNYCGPLVYK